MYKRQSEDSFIIEHYCPSRFSRQFGFHLRTSTSPFLQAQGLCFNFTRHACVRYGTNSQVLPSGQCLSLERKFTQHFQEWWSNVFFASSGTQYGGNSKRKRDSSTDQNIRREEGAVGSRPRLKIIRSQNPSTPLISTPEDDLSENKIPSYQG